MRLESILAVLRALDEADVRYLIAGGVAVNLHGYTRLTQDLDLVVELSPRNARAAVEALARLGYHPQVPVAITEFADPARREEWVTHKHMQVFSLISEAHPDTTVDLFVTEPFSFEEEYDRADRYELVAGSEVRTVRPETLIAMKRVAGRDRDRDDIQHLEWIIEERREGSDD